MRKIAILAMLFTSLTLAQEQRVGEQQEVDSSNRRDYPTCRDGLITYPSSAAFTAHFCEAQGISSLPECKEYILNSAASNPEQLEQLVASFLEREHAKVCGSKK